MATVLAPSRADRAFERLYRRYVADVYRYVLAVLQNEADAEDATQTAFLSAYRAYERGERAERPLNWLIAIAHNVCRQRFRESARRPRLVELHEETVPDRSTDEDGPSAEEIRRALGYLAFNQRAALVMREVQGRSYGEIAGIMGLSNSAVETLLFRARRAMREQLEGALTCGEAELALSKRADGELPFGERGPLRAHLRECRECAALERALRFRKRAIRSIGLVPVPSSLGSFFGGGAAGTGVGAGVGTGVGTGLGVGAKATAVVVAGVLGGSVIGTAVERRSDAGGEPAAATRARAVVDQQGARAGAAASPLASGTRVARAVPARRRPTARAPGTGGTTPAATSAAGAPAASTATSAPGTAGAAGPGTAGTAPLSAVSVPADGNAPSAAAAPARNPALPDVPSAPDTPASPSVPPLPAIPSLPSLPITPGAPQSPPAQSPAAPALPSVPKAPGVPHPDAPIVPALPSVPKAPAVPDVPKVSTTVPTVNVPPAPRVEVPHLEVPPVRTNIVP